MSEQNKRERDIFIRFADTGNIRKWDRKDFEGATCYVHHDDYFELLKEVTQLAAESVRREIALSKLVAEVEQAIRTRGEE